MSLKKLTSFGWCLLVLIHYATALNCRVCKGKDCVDGAGPSVQNVTCEDIHNRCVIVDFSPFYVYRGCVVKRDLCDDDDGKKLQKNYPHIWNPIVQALGSKEAKDMISDDTMRCCEEDNCNSSATSILMTTSLFFILVTGILIKIFG